MMVNVSAGGVRNEEEELRMFIRLAKQKGYLFRTLDTYISDNVVASISEYFLL
jgi:hypothetical protein